MMTPAKLAANRRNAERSTGPRTVDGKARASRNAVRHGLTARIASLSPADREEFMTLLDELERDWLPADVREDNLVEEIAVGIFMKRRILQIECEYFAGGVARNEVTMLADNFTRVSAMIERTTRYATAYDRRITRATAMLVRVLEELQESELKSADVAVTRRHEARRPFCERSASRRR